MAERSQFWSTGTTGDGATTITEAQTIEWFRGIMTPRAASNSPNTTQGILRGARNELAVSGTASPVSVATGEAVVEGYYYVNDASLNVTIPTPAANTRIDRIVLRAEHGTTRTVRVTRIAGTEGTGTAPSITQTAGTTWDIPLAQVSITTGGVITVTDQRTYCQFATDHVRRTGDTMTGNLTLSSVSPQLILTETDAAADNQVWRFNPFNEALLGQVLNDALSSSSNWLEVNRTGTTVDTINFPNGNLQGRGYAVPHLAGRQGGNASNWGVAGTTNYTPSSMRIQAGVIATSGGLAAPTFPIAFSASPIVVATAFELSSARIVHVSSTSTTNFGIITRDITGSPADTNVFWIAIGPI